MKKIATIIIFLSIGFASYAQVVFNKVYDNNNDLNGSFEIIETSGGGYLIAATYNGNGVTGIWVIKLTNLGDTIWTKQYDISINGEQAYSLKELINGGYILCGGFSDTITMTASAFLMKLDTQGDSLWMKKYETAGHDYANKVAQTPDGGFVLAGHQILAPSFSESDAWVLKTDSIGNLLWQKQLDEHGFPEYIEGLVVNVDSTIVIGGTTLLSSSSSRAYVVKLTPSGDVIWKKEFGGPIATDIFNMDTTRDKGYIIAGNTIINGEQRAYAAKLDSLGNVTWENDFARGNGPSENYSFAAIHELSNGNFMAAGADYDYTQTQPGDAPRVRLFEINSLGDSIWSKQYTHYGGTNDDYVFDMKLTSDGGYIMCGYIINGSLPQKNDVLAIKVDSNGCADTTCQISVGVATASNFKLQTPKIYPNPNSGKFTIEVADFKNVAIEIYNLTGQLVKQIALNSVQQIINLSKQPNGLYLLKITNNGQISTHRIIKQ
jgi:Secretion system C-terminal sorting domain